MPRLCDARASQSGAFEDGECRKLVDLFHKGVGKWGGNYEMHSVFLMILCSLPRQLFSGWHFDPGSQSDNGMPCRVGNYSTAAGAIDLLRPALRDAFSETGVDISLPIVFYVTQRPHWSAFNASAAAGPIRLFHLPGPNATPWDLDEANPVSET